MKSLFPYLVMIILFVMGAKLVNRQQKHTHSVRESAPVEHPITHFRRNLKDTGDSIREFYNDTTSLFDSSLVDTVSAQRKRVVSKPATGKATKMLTTTLGNGKAVYVN